MNNVLLADGTKGKQVIKVVDDQSQLPSPVENDDQELHQLFLGKNTAYSYVTTDLLRSVALQVQIIPNSSVQMSEALEKATELDFQQKFNLLYPDLANRPEMAKELAEKFDKDASKLILTPQPGQGMPGGAPGATPPGGVQPNAAPEGLPPPEHTPNSMNQAGIQPMVGAQNSVRNVLQQR